MTSALRAAGAGAPPVSRGGALQPDAGRGIRDCGGLVDSHRHPFPLPRSPRRRDRGISPSLPGGRGSSGIDALVSDAVDALNSLDSARAGRPLGSRPPKPPSLASAPASSRRVLGRLRRCAAEYAPPPAEVDRREALEDLLKCKDLYRIDESTTRVDMNLDWLKVCSGRMSLKKVVGVVGEEAAPFARSPSRYIFRTGAELADRTEHGIVPYMDPGLRARPGMLRELVRRLDEAGLIRYCTHVHSVVGLFTVTKKGGPWQRLVLDARIANHLHRRPPYAPLATPSAFENVDLADSSLIGDPLSCHPTGCGVDFQDGFYQFVFDQVAPWFASDLARSAAFFGASEVYDAALDQYVAVSGDTVVVPCFRGLPMGWSWALFFCHSALTSAMVAATLRFNTSLTREAATAQLVRDRCPPPRLGVRLPLLAPYVDNGNAISGGASEAEEYHKLSSKCSNLAVLC